jgi:hypothetical protein
MCVWGYVPVEPSSSTRSITCNCTCKQASKGLRSMLQYLRLHGNRIAVSHLIANTLHLSHLSTCRCAGSNEARRYGTVTQHHATACRGRQRVRADSLSHWREGTSWRNKRTPLPRSDAPGTDAETGNKNWRSEAHLNCIIAFVKAVPTCFPKTTHAPSIEHSCKGSYMVENWICTYMIGSPQGSWFSGFRCVSNQLRPFRRTLSNNSHAAARAVVTSHTSYILLYATDAASHQLH